MGIDLLTEIVSLVIALSVASERLVEIVKGLVPWLETKKSDAKEEGRRRAAVHVLAVIAGLITAYLGVETIPDALLAVDRWLAVAGLGLLASGGSGFWNSLLTYFWQVKNKKGLEATLQPGGAS